MADRQGGKSGDAGTRQDKPSAEEGKGTPEKVAAEAAEAKAAAAPKKKAAPRKPRAKKAEDTAAEETGVGQEEAATAKKPRAEAAAAAAAKAEKPEKAAPTGAPEGSRVQVRANAKYVRSSARKARLVCDQIRGKSVEEAFAILAHTPRHVAEDWRKLLLSAVANAEHNHELVGDDLRIASVHADEGPTLKRFRPRAMGRATRIRKRTSHLTITLTPKD